MPFQLITPQRQQELKDLVESIPSTQISELSSHLTAIIADVHHDIPEKRRISTGRYSIVKALGETLYPLLDDPFGIGAALFEQAGDPFVRSLGIQLLSLWGVETQGLDKAKPYFESAAGDEDWIVRECASGLVRKLVKVFPDDVRAWYLELVKSPDPNQRRFVSESLRPVVENRWFHKEPDYALGVIRHLFQESSPYPRTSVGNSLSDWMRVDPATAWPIVQELASNGDPNAYWIAYRACRNFVKKEPLKVMDLLGVDKYKYKSRIHKRSDY